MALDVTPEEKAVGQANFDRVAGELTRRDFMKSLALTGTGLAVPVTAAVLFNYDPKVTEAKPVKAALIGTGDEGGVLMGEHDPKSVQIIAVCDIRPSNLERIFKGEPKGPRKGLNFHYGRAATKTIKQYRDYKEMLAREKDIEMVIIALPLHLHAAVAIDCMNAGKHVLCEKLMAWDIASCKKMIKVADEKDVALAIGHQRHYSTLYAHAQEVMTSGVLGEVRHIRALWHRNNTTPLVDDKGNALPGGYKDGWRKFVPNDPKPKKEIEEDRKAFEALLKAEKQKPEKERRYDYLYESFAELCNWRLYKRTGGGLMAELGSHQLDACSIFLGKVHPLAVSGVGGKFFYTDEREVEDHVFCTFEFPGKHYDPKKPRYKDGRPVDNDIVVVTYSSISTNDFEKYGECVMGSQAALVVEMEQSIQLYKSADRKTAVGVTSVADGKPVLESGGSTPGVDRPAAVASGAAGGVSKGYREEMNHFAYCVRMWNQGGSKEDRPKLRCPGRVAMADAIIALTSNLAMQTHQRIEFQDAWFDAASDRTPEHDVQEKKNA
ncbi:MAG: Gfo/Idh/MocA family oxidoreductase [Planctomycetes bacterium]|nr:Gfo/Idh/MocA family oxidoreductase [Planctomycetota bacterium]